MRGDRRRRLRVCPKPTHYDYYVVKERCGEGKKQDLRTCAFGEQAAIVRKESCGAGATMMARKGAMVPRLSRGSDSPPEATLIKAALTLHEHAFGGNHCFPTSPID